MKYTLLFWLSLFFISPAIFTGAYLIDNIKNKKTVENTQDTSLVSTPQESDCIDRLINDERPLLNAITCDNYTFNTPHHWYLRDENLCNGNMGGANPLLNVDGFQSFEFRKKYWESYIRLIGFSRFGIESLEFGGNFENSVNIFKSCISSLGISTIAIESSAEVIFQMNPFQSNKVWVIWDRSSLGEISRDFYYTSKYATYQNALIRLSKDLATRSDQIGNLATITESSIDLIEYKAAIPLNKFNELVLSYAYSEFLYQIAERLIEKSSEIDPALKEVALQIKQKTDSELMTILDDYMNGTENAQNVQAFMSAIKLGLSVVDIIKNAPFAKAALAWLDVASNTWDFLTQFGDKQYNIPFFHATLGYTLSDKNLGDDCFGILLRTLSLTYADKCIHDYFNFDFVRFIINLCEISDQNGTRWHEITFDENRNKELNYLIRGYIDCGNPCNDNIKGKVINTSGQPLSESSIAIFNSNDRTIIQGNPVVIQINPAKISYTNSDKEGYFHIRLIEDGTYILRVSKEGYCTEEVEIIVKDGKMTGYSDIIVITLQKPKNITTGTLLTEYYYSNSLTIESRLTNQNCNDIIRILPYGTTFFNKNTYQQNVLISKGQTLLAFANSTTKYNFPGYCISRFRMGASGELKIDTTLQKRQYNFLTKYADSLGWHEKFHSDVQNSIWHYSDNIGVYPGSISDSLSKVTDKAMPETTKSSVSNSSAYKIPTKSALGSLICTVLLSLPLFALFTKKYLFTLNT